MLIHLHIIYFDYDGDMLPTPSDFTVEVKCLRPSSGVLSDHAWMLALARRYATRPLDWVATIEAVTHEVLSPHPEPTQVRIGTSRFLAEVHSDGAVVWDK